MRRALIIGGIALAVLVAAGAALVLLVDVNQYHGRIQTELEKQLNRPVTLGKLGLRIFPLSVAVDDVTIAESPAFATGRPFASVKQIRVHASLLPLLRKEIRVKSLLLSRPAIELVKNTAGEWNFSTLGPSDKSAPSGGGSAGGGFALDKLELKDGSVAVTDLARKTARSVYDHINATLKNLGPGKESHVELSANLSGWGKYSGTMTGAADVLRAGPATTARGVLDFNDLREGSRKIAYPVRVDFDLANDANASLLTARAVKMTVGKVPVTLAGTLNTKSNVVDAKVTASRASLSEVLSLARAFGADSMNASGTVSLDARAQGPLDALNYSGGGSLENASLELAALTKPLKVRSANIRFDGNAATLSNLACSLGSSNMKGSMTVRNFAAPDATFALNIDKLDIAELQQFMRPEPASAKQSGSSAPPRLNAKGTIDVGSILYSGVTLNNVHSGCTLNRGVVTLDPLTADVFGGKQSGTLVLDTRPQPATLAVKSKLDGVDANRLLSATTSLKDKLHGVLGAVADARMTLAPGGDIARTLNGNLSIKMIKGRLEGFNLMNEMATLGKFLGYPSANKQSTDISLLAGDLNIRDGVANTDNLKVDMEGGSVAATGAVNLVSQAMNLRLTAVLDAAMSKKVGGNQIGGYLTTALANNKGELVIPAIASGTLAHPVFAPDPGRMADMKLKGLLPSAGNPGALTSGLSGAISAIRGKPAQPAQPGKQQPPNSTQSILDALGSLAGDREKKK